jgi:hypothetical protein
MRPTIRKLAGSLVNGLGAPDRRTGAGKTIWDRRPNRFIGRDELLVIGRYFLHSAIYKPEAV